jgi:hypothetical protein
MKQISELTNLLSGLKGATGVSVTYRTNVKHNKTSRLDKKVTWAACFGNREIVKVQVINSNVGVNYENAVNNQQVREGGDGSFNAESLPYGSWIVPNVLLDNGHGELQLRTYKDMGICSAHDKAEYFWSTGETMTESDWAMVQPFLPPVREDGSAHQGVDKAVQCRNLTLAKIEAIKLLGQSLR